MDMIPKGFLNCSEYIKVQSPLCSKWIFPPGNYGWQINIRSAPALGFALPLFCFSLFDQVVSLLLPFFSTVLSSFYVHLVLLGWSDS